MAKKPLTANTMTESFNQLTPAQAERLALLAEECGEAVQAIGKILRHGYKSRHPDGGPTNRGALERECGDVSHAIQRLIDAEDIDNTIITLRALEKSETVEHYLHHQGALKNAVAPAEPMARFCPGCGAVGPIDKTKYIDCCPDGNNARMIPAGLAEKCHDLFQLALENAAAPPADKSDRPTDDELWDQTLAERDNAEDWADKLSNAIAEHFGVSIGEHSNLNLPWQHALDAVSDAPPQSSARDVLAEQWIDISNQDEGPGPMPEVGQEVLLWVWAENDIRNDDGAYSTQGASQIYIGQCIDVGYGPQIDCHDFPFADRQHVTHWMPLPFPPAEIERLDRAAKGPT